MTTLLNFVIGISAIYLFVSLFVTTIQELIAQVLALRARYLRVGIVKLLDQGKSDIGILGARSISTPLVDKFYSNPLIQALGSSRPGRTAEPSYVSKETFTAVALQITGLMGTGTTPEQILTFAKTLGAKANKTPLEYAIATFTEEAGGNLKKLQARLGDWFDESMERVGGAYKRWTQVATIIVGISFAAALNVDSIAISQSLFASPQQAAALADLAAKLPQGFNTDAALRTQLLAALEQTKVPFGWQDVDHLPAYFWIGWILTGLAASLGSAFWFDTLKRFVSIRSAGDNPSEKTSPKT
jgi:hypothetical protein